MRKELSPQAHALLDAADWLEQHEWIQGPPFRDSEGRIRIQDACAACAVGSVAIVSKAEALSLLGYTLYAELVNFNEAEGRTKEEVIAFMRRLAATV